MKSLTKHSSKNWILLVVSTIFIISACQKQIDKPATQQQSEEVGAANNNQHGHLQQTKTFSSEVAQKWQDLQVIFLRVSGKTLLEPGNNPYGRNGHRWFAYCGIALYESVVPGMPAYQSLHGQLAEMPEMPAAEPGKAYHWPTCANAALAYMTKHFFTSTDKIASANALENALNAIYQSEVDAETFQRSKDFGYTVAERIFKWSETDGYNHANDPYTPAGGTGSWTNTAPNPTAIGDPYWGNNRLLVRGSMDGTASPLPPTYSEDPNSDYYKMVKEVYEVSKVLTPEQRATALYFRDNPGWPTGTHFMTVFNEIMHDEDPQLDFYALAQAKTGIALVESMINCWKLKYQILQDRPTRYIRKMWEPNWNSLISIPAFPDFPDGHTQNGGAFAVVMTSLFGANYHFTIHTYDYLGMAPRTYNSFNEMAENIGTARVYAGIEYTYSCVEGKKQGEKIAANVLNILKFEKE